MSFQETGIVSSKLTSTVVNERENYTLFYLKSQGIRGCFCRFRVGLFPLWFWPGSCTGNNDKYRHF